MSDAPFGHRRAPTDAIPEGLTLAAFNTDCPESVLDDLGDALDAFLDVEDVTVGTTLTDDRPREFAALHDDVLVDGALVHPRREGDPTDVVAAGTEPFEPTDTLFLAGYDDRSGLRVLSNRVEALAWRAGRGRLYAGGQQRLAAMDDHWAGYRRIAEHGVEVHLFEAADYVPGGSEEFVVHGGRHGLAGTWLVAYDGDGNDAAKAALVAVERDPDSYYGLWTRVPALVDQIIERAPEYAPAER
ncbi:hypothetical protein [Halorussus halobius]|uniref:hypothetical protein n=1 Tax=Halorussus halobius TaxID=1710537 RepID=UPI0010927709|nr:hypothetical protein [Halorussus halobius]